MSVKDTWNCFEELENPQILKIAPTIQWLEILANLDAPKILDRYTRYPKNHNSRNAKPSRDFHISEGFEGLDNPEIPVSFEILQIFWDSRNPTRVGRKDSRNLIIVKTSRPKKS